MEEFVFGPIQTKWLWSLENNPERHGFGSLGTLLEDGIYRMCCLGELGLIGGKCEWVDGSLINDHKEFRSRYYLYDYKELGLYNAYGLPEGNNAVGLRGLALMNDLKYTWLQIASIVRANPTAYFSKSV